MKKPIIALILVSIMLLSACDESQVTGPSPQGNNEPQPGAQETPSPVGLGGQAPACDANCLKAELCQRLSTVSSTKAVITPTPQPGQPQSFEHGQDGTPVEISVDDCMQRIVIPETDDYSKYKAMVDGDQFMMFMATTGTVALKYPTFPSLTMGSGSGTATFLAGLEAAAPAALLLGAEATVLYLWIAYPAETTAAMYLQQPWAPENDRYSQYFFMYLGKRMASIMKGDSVEAQLEDEAWLADRYVEVRNMVHVWETDRTTLISQDAYIRQQSDNGGNNYQDPVDCNQIPLDPQNNCLENELPLFHYTSVEAIAGIFSDPNSPIIYPDSKGRTFLTPQRYSPDQVRQTLVFDSTSNAGKGEKMVVVCANEEGLGYLQQKSGNNPNDLFFNGRVDRSTPGMRIAGHQDNPFRQPCK